jgi:hypothetical protein
MKRSTDTRKTQTRIAEDLSETMRQQMDLTGRIVDGLAELTGQFARSLLSELAGPKTRTCCDVPEPCWMPEDLGEIECNLCAGGRGALTIRVTNTDFRQRGFEVVAAGPDAGRVTIAPASFSLGPKERRTVKATFDANLDDGVDCDELEALIWVFGCRNHYLRWTIDVGHREGSCCHEIEVRDQPDYEHHWYDHFYCNRQCFGPKTRPQRPEG